MIQITEDRVSNRPPMKQLLTIIAVVSLLLAMIFTIDQVRNYKVTEKEPTAHAQNLPEMSHIITIAPTAVVAPPEPTPVPEPVVAPGSTPAPVVEPVYVAPAYSGSHADWMAQAGIAESDYAYVDYIVSHESGWRVTVTNSIGAHGLCQALPGNKMASAGDDWYDNPITQLRWCNQYAQRYGGWYGSSLEWQRKLWW